MNRLFQLKTERNAIAAMVSVYISRSGVAPGFLMNRILKINAEIRSLTYNPPAKEKGNPGNAIAFRGDR